ncbi:MFS general substrate transporter [Annulohypoxylon maeteangense]|uniref:MFS general substrate transporter n=1 Tax=Annulohypoxylon maeteangense TaxID=1927788 RepID=UPI002008C11E|nr:MFS general substrate transporter [Annulohypoxylon maeteangense]KAI0886918.1 MFS general substrate transporter [Annulohypoxylon maeteangense]
MSEQTAGDDEITATTERTPLMRSEDTSEIPESFWKPDHSRSSTLASSIASGTIGVPTVHEPRAIISLFFLIIFAASAADAFKQIPMTRIFEDILCHQYYDKASGPDVPIDEELCKVNTIQSNLAYLLALVESLNSGVSCLVALFWGIVADRVGRKPVLVVCLIGMTLSLLWIMIVGWFSYALSPQLIWISSLAHLCGGAPVFLACIYSILSDVIPEWDRSLTFMRMHITSIVGNLISPALASAMMSSTGPWPLMLLAFILWIISLALVTLIPETLHPELSDDVDSRSVSFRARAVQGLLQLKDSLSIIRIRSVFLLLCIFSLSYPAIMCTLQFMVQFLSKRYHMRLAETGYVQSIYGIAHVAVVLILIPSITNIITKPSTPRWIRINEDKRDLVLVRWFYAASMTGSLILGVSPSLSIFVVGLIVMSFGSISSSFIKSIAASHVGSEHRSRLFTIIAIVEVGSNIWTMPALAGLFALGMKLGGEWIGLPYLGVSLTCLVMLLLSLFVRVPAASGNDEESPLVYETGTEPRE